MSGIRHSVAEAVEPYNPLNDGLDAFSNFVRMLKEYGCEAQLRARFDALVAPLAPPSAPKAAEPEELPTDLLETRLLIDACKHGEKMKMDGRCHNARRRMLAQAEKDFERGLQALRARA